ncbi:MAG: glycosyltransferase family 4 protein [Candidatus Dormibacteria bacterium]
MKPPKTPTLGLDASRMSAARTGIENYFHQLLPRLVAEWRKEGGEVVVFASDPAVAAHVEPPVRVVTGGGAGWTQVRLPAELRRAGVDVYFNPIPVLPLLLPMPCPAVVTVHDLLEFRGRWWYFRRLIGRSLGRAQAVVCVSQATMSEVVAEFPGVAPRVTVVREAADPSVFHEGEPADGMATEVLARLGLVEAPLLAIGTIQPRKNYARLLEAYAGLLSEGPVPPLVIVGRPGWEYEEVLKGPARLGIEDHVIFAGHLEDKEVAELIRRSQFLVAMSTGEGFGLPLVEAMYSGLPILASDIPAFREVAGNAALFVNPMLVDDIRAGLKRMLADEGLRRSLAEVGRGRRQLFSWDQASVQLAGILRAALTGV